MKQSTTRIRKAFRDPVTGEKSYVWADKITYRYDELEKGPIIVEFLKGALNAEEFVEKYHICSVQTLYALFSGNKHHDPRHKQHYRGADRRTEIGINPFDPNLSQDRRQTCKYC